jgi:hypothetical protein
MFWRAFFTPTDIHFARKRYRQISNIEIAREVAEASQLSTVLLRPLHRYGRSRHHGTIDLGHFSVFLRSFGGVAMQLWVFVRRRNLTDR